MDDRTARMLLDVIGRLIGIGRVVEQYVRDKAAEGKAGG